ncbi:hypothetical protein [Salinimicrobium soli]|uniref:hypothetical protein n=1 Tax=Salinimicrobium soli TaxID=1254399 RepID=UPI003AB061B4
MKSNILKIIAFLLFFFSISGILLHALFKLELIGHYCNYLLFDAPDDHLMIYTVTASMVAMFFSLLKRRKRKMIRS